MQSLYYLHFLSQYYQNHLNKMSSSICMFLQYHIYLLKKKMDTEVGTKKCEILLLSRVQN